jgi:hypothetical protein
VLEREVTAERVQAHFGAVLPPRVERWPLPNILALKLVLTTRCRVVARATCGWTTWARPMAAALLRMTIDVDDDELARCRAQPRVGWWPAVAGPGQAPRR